THATDRQQQASLLPNGHAALGATAQRAQPLIAPLRQASNVASLLNSAAAPTVTAQQQALAKLTPALGAERNFLAQVVAPNAACPGQPSCGIDEIFTGTPIGQPNHPNNQPPLTSTHPP